MRVDQSWHRAALAQLDVAKVAVRGALALLPRAHLREAPVADEHCLGHRPGGVQRVQRPCDEEIGHRETFAPALR